MPDDNPLTATPTPDPPEGTPPVDIAAALKDAVGEPINQLNQRLDTMDQRIGTLATPTPDPATPPTPPGGFDPGADQVLERIVSDPNGWLNENLITQLNQRVSPALQPMLEFMAQQTMTAQEAQVDATYGPGTFNEHVRPEVDKILAGDGFQGAQRYLPQAVETTVKAVLGDISLKGNTLHDRRIEAQKVTRNNPPQILGGGVPLTPARADTIELTTDDKYVLDALKNQGVQFDEKDMRFALGAPKTFNEWQEAKQVYDAKRKAS